MSNNPKTTAQATPRTSKLAQEYDDSPAGIRSEHSYILKALMLAGDLEAALEAARTREAELAKALKPFANFYEKYSAKPMKGVADSFYGIHSGTEWEADIKHSDMKCAYEALQPPPHRTTPRKLRHENHPQNQLPRSS